MDWIIVCMYSYIYLSLVVGEKRKVDNWAEFITSAVVYRH